ncbi:unnamed protein product, partial [Meganyctiphanes norvegica]
ENHSPKNLRQKLYDRNWKLGFGMTIVANHNQDQLLMCGPWVPYWTKNGKDNFMRPVGQCAITTSEGEHMYHYEPPADWDLENNDTLCGFAAAFSEGSFYVSCPYSKAEKGSLLMYDVPKDSMTLSSPYPSNALDFDLSYNEVPIAGQDKKENSMKVGWAVAVRRVWLVEELLFTSISDKRAKGTLFREMKGKKNNWEIIGSSEKQFDNYG